MASRDLSTAFFERRSAANLRRKSSSIDGGSRRMASFGISKKTGSNDDHLLIAEEGLAAVSSSSLSQAGMGLASLPPQWVDDVDAIHSSLSEITRLMGLLNSMHASRLGSVFGKDLDDMEGQIENLTREITDKFRMAERSLQKVGAATRRAGGEEATVGANVQRSLAKKLQELSVQFRQKQRKYLADVKIQKGTFTSTTEQHKFGGIDFHQDVQPHDEALTGFTTQQLGVIDDLQEEVQSRDTEIAQIAQSIEELGAIFKELAVLVIDQGTILDRIDYNMEAVVEHTKEGIQQLEKAEKHQKSARPMKCIIFLLCMIAFLLIILILKHRRRWR